MNREQVAHTILDLCALRRYMNISVWEDRIAYYLEQLNNIDGKVPMGQLPERYHQNKEKQVIGNIFGHASICKWMASFLNC